MKFSEETLNHENFKILMWLNTLTAIGMATCVITGQIKISFEIFGYSMMFPAANIFFALLTFPITDIIADIYGKKQANITVWIGFVSQMVSILIFEVCMLLPGDTTKLQPFHIGGWLVLAGSATAYLSAQFWDVYFFHWIKENWTGEKHLWIRNNLSTFSSQLINSTIFISIVFGIDELLIMLSGSIVIKWIIALLDTPFVYLGKYYFSKVKSCSKGYSLVS